MGWQWRLPEPWVAALLEGGSQSRGSNCQHRREIDFVLHAMSRCGQFGRARVDRWVGQLNVAMQGKTKKGAGGGLPNFCGRLHHR